jgi:hypothetical protein
MRSAAATGGSASEVMLDFDAIDALEAIFIFAVIAGVTWHDGRATIAYLAAGFVSNVSLGAGSTEMDSIFRELLRLGSLVGLVRVPESRVSMWQGI